MNIQLLSIPNSMRISGCTNLVRASILAVSVMLLLLFSASCALAWPVEDLKILPGEDLCVNSGPISIEGMVGPGDYVTITTTYVKEVSVLDGKYEFDAGIVPIPAGTTLCSVTAEGVKDLTISTNLYGIIPLSKSQDACNAKASMSVSYIPKGNYSLVISGNAAGTGALKNCDGPTGTDPVNIVKITFVAKMDVKADKDGYFKQVCCTNRPAGEYTLKIGDKTKVITLRDCSNGEEGGFDGGSNTGEVATINSFSSSGGTGEAKVVPLENALIVGNESVQQSVPETTATVESPEAIIEQPESSVEANSFMQFVRSILNLLGF